MSHRFWRRLIPLAIAVACVVVASVGLHASEPAEFDAEHGRVGVPIDFNGGELTVTEVRVGSQLTEKGVPSASTLGLFVVLAVDLSAPEQKITLTSSGVKLYGDGREYHPYGSLTSMSPEPGFISTADFVFEVDPQHIDDLRAEFAESELISGFQQHAVITFGIDHRNAELWRAAGSGRQVEVAEFESVRPIL